MIILMIMYYQIDGLNFERRDRDGRLGGDILVYISNQIPYKRRTDLEIGNGIETIWLKLVYPNIKPILVYSAYRPPSEITAALIPRLSCQGTLTLIMQYHPRSFGLTLWRSSISRGLSSKSI